MRPRRPWWLLAGSGLRAAAAGLARVLVAGRPQRVILPPSVVAIQLLPVENETGDPGLDALARQLTGRLEEWISELHFVHFMVGPKVLGVGARVSATLYRKGELVEIESYRIHGWLASRLCLAALTALHRVGRNTATTSPGWPAASLQLNSMR